MVSLLTTAHDQRLSALLQQVSHDIEAAQSKRGLIEVINRVKAFGGPLKFNHHRLKLLAAATGIIALLTGIFSDDIFYQWNLSATPVVIISGVCTLGLIVYMWRKSASVRASAERLFLRALLFDNQLQELTSGLPTLQKALFADYFEFRRGNYSRTISAAYAGHYQGDTHAFAYHFYHFHYVDEREISETDGKGHTRTRKVYNHYDRYGIALDFRFIRQIAIIRKAISGVKGERYKPSSNQFNRLFKVTAETEMAAAHFLKPAVVLACEEAATGFKALNLEFNQQGGLCMSFDNKKVISGVQQYDFSSADGFIAEVENVTPLPELRKALEFIHMLMVHSDNNFKKDNE